MQAVKYCKKLLVSSMHCSFLSAQAFSHVELLYDSEYENTDVIRVIDNIKMQQTLDPAVPRHDVAYYFNFSRIIPDVYICCIVSFYLVACFKVRGQILKPGEEPSLSGTWSRYYEYLGKTLGIVNDCIRGVGPWSRRIGGFGPILNMFDSDFVLNGSTWPAHATGAFAYIDSVGGMYALLRENFQHKGYRAIALLM